MFNLIPSCYACNHIKRDILLDISPYSKGLNENSYYKFSYRIKSIDYIKKKENIKVIIRELERNKNNAKVLKLSEAYEIHNDVVQEILIKKIVYSNSQINELLKNFKGLFNSTDEIDRIIYGNYLNEEELHKRPLAKLMSDIIK
jgi:hypothetical protein